ncbi:MAG: hypothetical protein KJ930_04125 [Gammaproteobacteria bacterium]|nr:hypothetical protein [Gammaproteobacteria bacterium]MBU2178601.1 hypothetical protein [Gammaproteobacteria bacterium]MBU2223293.1 hypothetical protein [Gammaproteobacteria bacterium]MBU2427458.1 hypothetical protein [Gammaproteobacteria bacterium]
MTVLGIGWQLYVTLFGLMVFVPSLLALVLLIINRRWLKTALWSVLSCTTAFLLTSWWVSDNKVQFVENNLQIQAGFYQTTITDLSLPETSIDVLTATELGPLTPKNAVNGIHLPNYRVGWYRLQNNELAFVMLIGDYREVTVVRTRTMMAIVSGDIHRDSLLVLR